jgi:hypothetical protein
MVRRWIGRAEVRRVSVKQNKTREAKVFLSRFLSIFLFYFPRVSRVPRTCIKDATSAHVLQKSLCLFAALVNQHVGTCPAVVFVGSTQVFILLLPLM